MANDSGSRVRIDMHLHTSRSFDSLNDPLALLDVATARGIDVLCITDHNEISTALMLRRRFPDRIIVGEEVKTAEGVDIIGLYIQEKIPRNTPARMTCDLIHEQGGLVYVPHPFARGKGGNGKILELIADQVDAVEGFNARLHDQQLNERAVAWAKARGLPLGAGSDAHTLHELGRAFVEIPRFGDDAASFRSALAAATIHGQESSRAVHLASTYAKMHKLIFTRAEED
jgi:predicted metal-dependent phosphoesterase TrpH